MKNAPTHITILPFDATTLKLSVPYDPLTVEKFKLLPKRQWSSREKCWFIPNDKKVVDDLALLFRPERIIDRTVKEKESRVSVSTIAPTPRKTAPLPLPAVAVQTSAIQAKPSLSEQGAISNETLR